MMQKSEELVRAVVNANLHNKAESYDLLAVHLAAEIDKLMRMVQVLGWENMEINKKLKKIKTIKGGNDAII